MRVHSVNNQPLNILRPSTINKPRLVAALTLVVFVFIGMFGGATLQAKDGKIPPKPFPTITSDHKTPVPQPTCTSSAGGQSNHVMPWAVGQEAVYQITYYSNGQVVNVEQKIYRIVGKITVGGSDYYNLESLEVFGSGSQAVTHVVEKFIQPLGVINFKELLFGRFEYKQNRWITQNNFDLTIEKELPPNFEVVFKMPDPPYQMTRNQSVTVKAGVFNTVHLTTTMPENFCKKSIITNTDFYGSDRVPIWGAVRWTIRIKPCEKCEMGGNETVLELIRYGQEVNGPTIVQTPVFMSMKDQEKYKVSIDCPEVKLP